MRKHHPKNERIKRQYLAYLEEAKRMSVKSTDQVAAAIAAFEASTGYKDFAQFHIEQARKFKRDLANAINPKTAKPLAKATIRSRLMHVKAFIHWLAGQPGYKSRISYSDAEYFNPSANDTRIATAKRERPVPSIEQIRHVIFSSPAETEIQKRDRALIAFTLLTGARDDAIASLSIKHLDLQARAVFQDAREVRTKNRKTFTTWFFPVGDDIEAIIRQWIEFLTTELKFGPGDPLFPATEIGLDKNGHFASTGLKRAYWKTASPIRDIFRRRFEAAGLPYFHPHSFRKTLARLGTAMTTTTEEWAAWSQNLGHEDVKTTFQSYAKVPSHRQAEIFKILSTKIGKRTADSVEPDQETIARVLAHLHKKAS